MTLSTEDPAVDGARGGDPTAWADLYERFHPTIARYLEVLAPDVDPETIWGAAARALPGQPVGIKPLVWLLRVCREVCVHPPDPDQTDSDVIAMVRRLPPLQMEIITLRVVGGLADGDVAAVVGWPETRVVSAAHHALAELARQVDVR